MYPIDSHWRDLKGKCPVCGNSAHIVMSDRAGRFFWYHDDGLDGHLAEISWEEFKTLYDDARGRGVRPSVIGNHRGPVSKRVRCVETGEEYRSVHAAAEALLRDASNVRSAIKRGGTCGGWHWEFV